tara:strand:- start:3083 stop:3487 length:405 start_codon:yes stop_codon:yes gene_type:complete
LKRIFAGTIIFLIFTSSIWANTKYFQRVIRTAKNYRIETSQDDMKVIADAKGKQAFYITLKSNRNNFEMVMLVGFIAAGEAMKTGFEPDNVFVTIDVPLGEGLRMVTTAEKKDVKELLSGKINSAQFARKIKYL